MNTSNQKRRQFLQMGMTGISLFATGLLVPSGFAASRAPFDSVAGFGPLQAPDENGVMLPPGFRSRIVARSGQRPSSNSDYVWHASPDGGACYAADDGGWVYVSNCEETNGRGGAGALRFNAAGSVIDAYSILDNTDNNCAGGATPWGTWLSCEEVPRGQVYECDPFGQTAAQVRPSLGTFEHEAAAIDLLNDCVYLTEDEPDGGFYRFRSERGLPDLESGTLEIAERVDTAGGVVVRWHEVPDPHAELIPTRNQVAASSPFAGGEGIAVHEGKVYFVTKRDNRIWCYDIESGSIEVLYDAENHPDPILTGVDNVLITPRGDVLVAEDGGNMQIVAMTPDQRLLPLLQIVGQDRSEICGPAFDPSFERLHFSSQRGESGEGEDGLIYEISVM